MRRALWLAVALVLLRAHSGVAQTGAAGPVPEAKNLVQASAAPVAIAAGGAAEAVVTLLIQPTWHINANPPSPDYMIPTRLELAGGFGVSAGRPVYPAPKMFKVGFEENPLSVYDGQVALRLPLRAAAGAVNGTHALTGKLTFQACNDQVCLAPATVPVEIAVSVTGGAPGSRAATPDTEAVALERGPPAAADTTPPPAGTGFTTTPPGPGASRSAVADNPLSRALDRGGWAAFVALFLIGLALNLTPCVYPMIGVTVSIFGARRAARPLQIFGHAVLYVLGMAVMYSTLGLVAALTGGLFGGLLGNPVVLVGIGGLLIALSLSMFGLYQLQAPPALLNRLGGTAATSAAGVFGSGLVVGIFAAPCVGPPVIALLAVVGAKGDPWYGFWSFFVLAMGLGAPYLVLGTFTNLLRSLPRSGEWLAWTEKVFGTILLSLGVFYTLLGLAPAWAPWVAPLALLVGGITLGFIERSADARRGFFLLKRVGGAAAVAAGVFLIATALSERIAFEPFSPAALDAILKSGRPVMLDFTASWCVPCHELERLTFTDRRVREAARAFRAFRVDLTHYDSPESERWRRMFGISGVPTVLFLKTDGSEVRAARVEGFIPPEGFLARMRVATEQAGQDSTR